MLVPRLALLLALAPTLAWAEQDVIGGDSTFEAEDFARANLLEVTQARLLSRVDAYVDCDVADVDLSVWRRTDPLGSAYALLASATAAPLGDGWVSAALDTPLDADQAYAIGFWSSGPCTYSWASAQTPPTFSWTTHAGGVASNGVVASPEVMYGPGQPIAYAMRLESSALGDDDDSAASGDDDDNGGPLPPDEGSAGCALSPAPRLSWLLLFGLLALPRRDGALRTSLAPPARPTGRPRWGRTRGRGPQSAAPGAPPSRRRSRR